MYIDSYGILGIFLNFFLLYMECFSTIPGFLRLLHVLSDDFYLESVFD